MNPVGLQHVRKQTDPDKKRQLQPGLRYRLTAQWTANRLSLQETTATAQLRHRCYLQRQLRPCCPHFENSPVPIHKEGHLEANARLTMTYFRAWTLQAPAASGSVPFVGRLQATEQTWVDALRMWLAHLPREETKHILEFSVRVSGSPERRRDANSDDSGVDERRQHKHHRHGSIHHRMLPNKTHAIIRSMAKTRLRSKQDLNGFKALCDKGKSDCTAPEPRRDPMRV